MPTNDAHPAWHTLAAEAAAESLETDLAAGLPPHEASLRLAQYGPNELIEQGRRNFFRIALAQFSDFMIVVLIAAALISWLVGDSEDAIVIFAIVLLNGAIGFAQEIRAERAIAALKQLAALTAEVVRAGRRMTLAAAEIVPGDLVRVEAGNAVPADLRLVESSALKINESSFTGESVPVEKQTGPLPQRDAPLAERVNMAFKGTVATYGRGLGLAVATGMATELGKIAGMLAAAPAEPTPLQKRLAAFGRQLGFAVLAVCAVVFAMGLWRGEPILLMLLTAISLAVAAIPEALPAVVTVMLATAARTMARRQALVRRLPAVETLGSVSCICTDKTGTLTLNEMRARQAYIRDAYIEAAALDPSRPSARRFLAALALCNDAARGEERVAGDPTEIALWRLAADAGFDKAALERSHPRVLELPFDSERKRMTTIHRAEDGFVAFTKGAPESVLGRCVKSSGDEADGALAGDKLLAAAEAMAGRGLRVLAIAERRWDAPPEELDVDFVERDLTLLGLIGLVDPPRPEAKNAVALCKSAGIVPVMITGDHPATARAIAVALGITGPDDPVLTGEALARLGEPELADRIKDTRVYARVDPAQKIRIVKAARASGQFVAMTGDGVNDAPALAYADIGVAMGKTGTDVAREAASLILLDDNFATIVAAVAEGRRIFDNVRKFVSYVLTCNAAEIWTILLAPFFGLPLPLLPIHILWINLVTDGLPGLALAAEPAEAKAMQRPPRPANEGIFAHGMWRHILWIGLAMSAVTLGIQAYAIRVAGLAHWQTMVFTVLTLSQMGAALATRSERESLFRQGLFSNRYLVGAVFLTMALQLLLIYVPFFNDVFKTAPLSAAELALCLVVSSVVFFVVEAEKWLARRGLLRRGRPEILSQSAAHSS